MRGRLASNIRPVTGTQTFGTNGLLQDALTPACACTPADQTGIEYRPYHRDTDFQHHCFANHETLRTPGRGYLKGDVLEIRAIVKLHSVHNMAPPPPPLPAPSGAGKRL